MYRRCKTMVARRRVQPSFVEAYDGLQSVHVDLFGLDTVKRGKCFLHSISVTNGKRRLKVGKSESKVPPLLNILYWKAAS